MNDVNCNRALESTQQGKLKYSSFIQVNTKFECASVEGFHG